MTYVQAFAAALFNSERSEITQMFIIRLLTNKMWYIHTMEPVPVRIPAGKVSHTQTG